MLCAFRNGARAVAVAAIAFAAGAPAARAAFVTVHGGATSYDAATKTGAAGTSISNYNRHVVNDAGRAVGFTTQYVNNVYKGDRPQYWGVGGAGELPHNGPDANGRTGGNAYSINNAGVMVGAVDKIVSGVSLGGRPVRWNSPTEMVELQILNTKPDGSAHGAPFVINDLGIAAGYVSRWNGSESQDVPVRWDANGVLTELGALPGYTAKVHTLNNANVAAGLAIRTVPLSPIGGTQFDYRAMRWEAAGSATELQPLEVRSFGAAQSGATDINEAGVTVGYSVRTLQPGGNRDSRPVKWDAAGNVAELPAPATAAGGGYRSGNAAAINGGGVIVGSMRRFSASAALGSRPLRWDSAGIATELAIPGLDSAATYAEAYAVGINDLGITVGTYETWNGATQTGEFAVMWSAAGAMTDLNSLIDPSSGWTLTNAIGISETNFIAGVGKFDPDLAGPATAYNRHFLIQVPEPTSAALALPLLFGLTARRRRRNG